MTIQSQPINLYSIIGPTAVGKTQRAFDTAEELMSKHEFKGVNIISADSRQVYRGIEITSGADIPLHFSIVETSTQKYFEDLSSKIRIYGVSLIEPEDEWSVAHFVEMAAQIIEAAPTQNRATIVVGGAGLFHEQLRKYLAGQRMSLGVSPNLEIRSQARHMDVEELQTWLGRLDAAKLANLNQSDRNNPRRLVRAIEIAQGANLQSHRSSKILTKNSIQWQTIGVFPQELIAKANLPKLHHRIEQRVDARIKAGAVEEIRQLVLRLKPTNDGQPQIFSTLGVAEILTYLKREIDLDQLIKLWSLHEFQYAKRQLTWWKV